MATARTTAGRHAEAGPDTLPASGEDPDDDGTPPSLGRGRRRGASTAVLAALLAGVALVLRSVGLTTAYDLHIDEVTYARIADAVARTGAVDLYGEPFFLHPPLVFLLEGLLLRLTGDDGADLAVVLSLRVVPVLAAALATAALVVLVQRVTASRVAAAAAGTLFALDPFLLRQTSRNLLESPSLLFVLVSVTAAAFLVPRAGEPARAPWPLEVLTGVAAGLALLTKEPTAFVVVLPLVAAAATGWSVPRASAVRAVVLAAAVYAVYPVTTFAVGRGEPFLEEKLSGVLRLVGARQETGFNAGRGPSLAEAVLENLPDFAPTYALLLLSGPAVLVLLLRGTPLDRWLATWTGCAQALMAYLVVGGTLEEQFFSYLVVPSVAASVAAVVVVARQGRRSALVAAGASTALLTAFALVAVPSYVRTHGERHDAYVQALDALRSVAPCGAAISASTQPLTFLLQGYRVVDLGGAPGPREEPVGYAVTASKLVEDGFGSAGEDTLALLEQRAVRVFTSTESDSAGRLVVWRLPGAPRGTCPVPQR